MSWNIAKPGDQINGPVAVTGNLNVDSNTLFVDSANNRVGVLTASPTVPLDVVGDAKVSGNLTVDTNTLVVDAANNRLGIGTATPNATVSIKQSGAQIDVSTSATDVTFEAIDRAATTNAVNTRWYTRNGEFQWNNSSYSRAMTLDSSGNLGLGAVSPSQRLFVQSASSPIAAFNSTSVSGPYLIFQSSGTSFGDIGSAKAITGSYNATDMALNARSAASMYFCISDVAKMVLDANGRLGIGTATPAYPLDISASKAVSRLTSSTGTNGAFSFFSNTGGAFYIGLDNSAGTEFSAAYSGAIWHSGAYPIVFATSNAEKMRLDSSGRLGIGTASPSQMLDVNGNARFRFSSGTGGGFWLDGALNANRYFFGTESSVNDNFRIYDSVAGTNRLTLDSSGNLGLAVTPAAWSGFKALQIARGSLTSFGADTFLSHNWYWSGTADTYIANDYATRYYQSQGKHIWDNGGTSAGTAGATISFATKMTLDASGRLGIGTATVDGKVHIYGDTYQNSQLRIQRNGAVNGTFSIGVAGSNNTLYIQDEVNSTARLVIDASGNLIVGTTGGSFRGLFQVQSGSNRDLFGAQVAGASNGFTIKWNHSTTTLRVNIQNLPTSASGLSSGDIWIDTTAGNVLKIA